MTNQRVPIWWLHPMWPIGLMVGVTLTAAWLQSDQAYELYGTPKYVQLQHVALGALYLAVFALGCGAATYLYGRNRESHTPQALASVNDTITKAFRVSFGLTMFGYCAWLIAGVMHGFSPLVFFELLFQDSAERAEQIRVEMFPKYAGITTCTQFAYSTLALGLWLYFQRPKRSLLLLLLIVTTMAMFRAIVVSERSALIELMFPWFFIGLRMWAMNRPLPAIFWKSVRMAPIVAPLAGAVFFGAFEYVRSWRWYQDEFDSYVDFTTWRLIGYFTTAHNNGAMALASNQIRPLPYFTIRPIWQFPGVPESDFSYESLTGYDMEEEHWSMLENHGNEEYNNEGGLFQPLLDWGLPLSFLFWWGYGYLAGAAYQGYLGGEFWGVTLFPLLYLSLLEVPLILFLLYTRTTPSLAMLVLTYLLTWRKTRHPVEGASARGTLEYQL